MRKTILPIWIRQFVHIIQCSWYFRRHQVQKHKVPLGLLIMVKTNILRRTLESVHISYSFHSLLDGMKRECIKCF